MIQGKKRSLSNDSETEAASDTESNETDQSDSSDASVATINFISIKDPKVHRKTNRSLFAIKNSFVMNGVHNEEEVNKMLHLLVKSEKEASIYAVMEMVGFLRDIFVNTNKGNTYTEIDHERKRLKSEISLIKDHVLTLNTLINKMAWVENQDSTSDSEKRNEGEGVTIY